MHYTYIIYYIDRVYTYVVFVQIDKYIYTWVRAHVQIHTDVLEAICTTHELLEPKDEPCWSQLGVRCSFASDMSITPVSLRHVNHPSEPPTCQSSQ